MFGRRCTGNFFFSGMKLNSQGEIVGYQSCTPGPDAVGEIEQLSMWTGQGLAMIDRVRPAEKIVPDILTEAQETLCNLRI